MNIVNVCDEIACVEYARDFISQECGFKTIDFTDSSKALEYLRVNSREVDLLLTDYKMPDPDGYELAHCFDDLLSKPASLILHSGCDYPKGLGVFKFLRPVGFLFVPFDQVKLKTAIDKAISLKNSTQVQS